MLLRAFSAAWMLVPAIASAQTTNSPSQGSGAPRHPFVYEVFAGGTRLTTDGALTPAPAGAPPPPARATTGSVGMGGGFEVAPHLALVGQLEIIAGRHINAGGGSWGALHLFGVMRVRLPAHMELEAGGGAAQLGYQPPTNISLATTRYWSPAARAGVGYDLYRFEHVAVSVYARASVARFEGMPMRTASVQVAVTGRVWR